MKKLKTVNIEEEFHNLLLDYKEKTGISIKVLIETAVNFYLKHMRIEISGEDVMRKK